jgi:hypothetical protein
MIVIWVMNGEIICFFGLKKDFGESEKWITFAELSPEN